MLGNVTLKGCIEFAIATEELGAEVYMKLAAKFSDGKEISDLFSHLAADEKIHKQQFSELLKKSSAGKGTGETAENREYLKAMSVSEFFSHHRGPLKDIANIQDRNDALQIALDFEKATLGFYKAMEDVIGKQEPLSQVIETERNHVIVLMKALVVEGSAFRGLQEKWP